MLFSFSFDHLVIAARSLDEGTAYVEAVLGVKLSPGGQHGHMGTHNRLLSLGPLEYLEVIAVEPGAPAPPTGSGRSIRTPASPAENARWFVLTA